MARVEYKTTQEKFVNPYHFVPLGEKCDRRYDYEAIKKEDNLLTGWIECELETKSPVFVPNPTNDDVFALKVERDSVKSYDFLSREDLSGRSNPEAPARPVIPGSELRGVFRSAFEAVTNSCMSTTDDESVLFKRTTTPGKPGRVVLEDGKWFLQPCEERIGVAAWKNYAMPANMKDPNDFSGNINALSEGAEVSFEQSARKYKNSRGVEVFYVAASIGRGRSKGFLHKGESFFNKHHETLFVPDTRKEKIPLDERDLENLVHNFKLYADEKVNQSLVARRHKGYRAFLERAGKKNADELVTKDLENALVYYKQVGSCIYLCPAAIGREVFHNRLKDLLGSFVPCEEPKDLCPACALFGFVGKNGSVAGRVRFSDAELSSPVQDPDSLFLPPMVLPELASPKPSATEFYLERPSEKTDLWNYDYTVSWNNKQPVALYKARIRGRKFYWHNLETQSERLPEETISKRHVKVRPVRQGVSFRFKVYFNEVNENELKQLLWVLSVGNSEGHGHKIGMGKPVGLGSILVKAADVVVRSVGLSGEWGIEYATLSRRDLIDSVRLAGANEKENVEQAARLLGGDPKSVRAFLKITKFENGFRDLIDYPRLDTKESNCRNKNAVFQWFVGNKLIRGTGVNPKIDQSLQPIEDPKMLKIQAKEQQFQGRDRKR